MTAQAGSAAPLSPPWPRLSWTIRCPSATRYKAGTASSSGGVIALDSSAPDRSSLRLQMKARRRSLSQQQLARAGRDIARELRRSHALKPGQRIALYCPARGEAPIADIARHARMLGCELHLPLIVDLRARKMMFVRWSSDTKLQRHRWGFMQPVSRKRIPLRALDVVFVPAVAVDARGMRLGAGAGFYDRLFHFRRESPWRKPRLIAVVHDFQRVQHIDGHSWDVPVDAVLSESGLHRVHR